MKTEYAPGRRNIGPNEVSRRRRHGFIGAGATIFLFLLLIWMDAPPLARVLLAAPIFVAALGFIQAASET